MQVISVNVGLPREVEWHNEIRITVDPEQCGGRPCVRGTRIRVSDVLDLFAAGLTGSEILDEMPDLEPDVAGCR